MKFDKIKILLLFLFLLSFPYLFGQNNNKSNLSHEEGILVFEGKEDVFDIYFIKTTTSNLRLLLSSKDTLDAIEVETPFAGCIPMYSNGFKDLLAQPIAFDSLYLLMTQENHLGQSYEDTTNLYFKFGSIKYNQLLLKEYPYNTPGTSARYKKIQYGDRIQVIAIWSRKPIEGFSDKTK
jgi:hypothetical protein